MNTKPTTTTSLKADVARLQETLAATQLEVAAVIKQLVDARNALLVSSRL